ncbi:DNA-binding response regulator, LytR/AlgR family [Catalinimonas alkaloidigena]|uniref:DNA-binding response regulator, LytR/AlgR family n=1 Tax=Catalinimonas alkaloidigena TaxID=1075417 RepID=A0A1G8WQ70_9BACT|nr:LytTR family DNA-binding domain-containing protein [Catalinimonas alkaloidigena]SDJ79765.1 DNA-binding response regulator, LytR/AlgR family [Catalinimonas alkaloidigena]
MIVDDEELARFVLKNFIKQTDFLTLGYECESAIEAVNILQKDQVDLIFLDVQMPEMSGLELLESLDHLPPVILVTSKKDYAAEAFEHSVVDYLVKPIQYPRFIRAVMKVKEKQESRPGGSSNDDIFIRTDSKIVKLNYSSILYVEALADYVMINTTTNRHIVHSTMKGMERKLPADTFARVHRSFIVNLPKVQQIKDLHVVINDKEIPIGASYKDKFMKRLKFL